MQIDNKIAKVNGQEVVLDSPMDKRTFIPIRFVMESLGATVTWDAILHKVTIVYPEPLD
jgi:hypothetical protein